MKDDMNQCVVQLDV